MDHVAVEQSSIDKAAAEEDQLKQYAIVAGEQSENVDTEHGGEENKFQKAITAWRNINLTKLIPTLDIAASDLVAYQRDALVERKELAQKTKEFRKLEDSAKLNEIKSLLKAYQSYIDLVTNQSKSVSSSFFHVYSSLSEAPDPYPLLEASVDSLLVADEIVPKLEDENKQLQHSTAELTGLLEHAEGQLNAEVRARQSLEESVERTIKGVEDSWSAVLEEKQGNWEAQKRNLQERAENHERLLKGLKASYEVSQRLDRDEDGEKGSLQEKGIAAELDIVSSDLERANSRLAEIEAKNEQLRIELAQFAMQRNVSQPALVVEDHPAYLHLRTENSALLRKVEAAKYERDLGRRELETVLRNLKKEITAHEEDNRTLRGKLQKCSDYEDIKRELDVLKSLEFSTGYSEEPAEEEELNDEGILRREHGKTEGQDTRLDLEQLLLARNKKLNHELTVLRLSHQDSTNRLEALENELSSTNAELEKSKNLTTTLENDLLRIQQEVSSPHPAPSVSGTHYSRYPSASLPRRGRAPSPTSSIISGFDNPTSFSSSLEAIRAAEPVGGGSGMLPMIIAQRDRFKKRNSELEEEISKTYQSVTSLRSEVAALQKDNLVLYEKTRYMTSYGRNQPPSPAATQSHSPTPSAFPISDSNLGIERYRSAYESNHSPFTAFRGRESARVLKLMGKPERAGFRFMQMVLATRMSRNLFVMYCLGLHLLMLFLVYHSGGRMLPDGG